MNKSNYQAGWKIYQQYGKSESDYKKFLKDADEFFDNGNSDNQYIYDQSKKTKTMKKAFPIIVIVLFLGNIVFSIYQSSKISTLETNQSEILKLNGERTTLFGEGVKNNADAIIKTREDLGKVHYRLIDVEEFVSDASE